MQDTSLTSGNAAPAASAAAQVDVEVLLEQQEEVLAPALGLCVCGHADARHAFIAGLLHEMASGNAPMAVLEAGAREAPLLFAEVFLHQLDNLGLLEHGGSIAGAWGVVSVDLAMRQSSVSVGLTQPLDHAALAKEMSEMVQATLQDPVPGGPANSCKAWIEGNPKGAAHLFYAFLAERQILDPALFGSQLTGLGAKIATLPQLRWRDFV